MLAVFVDVLFLDLLLTNGTVLSSVLTLFKMFLKVGEAFDPGLLALTLVTAVAGHGTFFLKVSVRVFILELLVAGGALYQDVVQHHFQVQVQPICRLECLTTLRA